MKQTIEHLENLIRHDLADRHEARHYLGPRGYPSVVIRPPHTEDRERIRDYVRALRVLRWAASHGAWVKPAPFHAGALVGRVTDPEADNYGEILHAIWHRKGIHF